MARMRAKLVESMEQSVSKDSKDASELGGATGCRREGFGVHS